MVIIVSDNLLDTTIVNDSPISLHYLQVYMKKKTTTENDWLRIKKPKAIQKRNRKPEKKRNNKYQRW